jgi:2-succinyl-6-hydroxy-2,4-cyclohexadiene-1-carboxylate synthase
VPETLVLLHGFAGTRRSWDDVVEGLDGERYRPLALDLRGHGARAAARPITFGACVEDVLAAAPGRFALCGYSLGGRVALHVALAHPERLTRLVLVATTAGIEDPAQRAERRASDEALATWAQGATPEAFAERWMGQPLFVGTPPAAAARWHEDLVRNDPRALTAALRGLGAGVMAPLWDRLGGLDVPTTVVAGERDPRYVALGRRLATAIGGAQFVIVPSAGHGLPREAPAALAASLS